MALLLRSYLHKSNVADVRAGIIRTHHSGERGSQDRKARARMPIAEPTLHCRRGHPRRIHGTESVPGLVAGRVETSVVSAGTLRLHRTGHTHRQAARRSVFTRGTDSTLHTRHGVTTDPGDSAHARPHRFSRRGGRLRAIHAATGGEHREGTGTGPTAYVPAGTRTSEMTVHGHYGGGSDGPASQQPRYDRGSHTAGATTQTVA